MHSQNRQGLHCLHVARFCIEAQSAFSIASGLTDVAFDNLVVRDANGLPAIPGTSLAGVIRQQYQTRYPSDSVDDELALSTLFGDHLQDGGLPESEESIKSRVEFSWGVIHDSNNQPVEGLRIVEGDPVLAFLQQDHPIVRDRVRINDMGCAEHQAKFDKTTIPQGARFSAEMTLWADSINPVEWDRLCRLLADNGLRIGSSVGVGMGRFHCVSLKCRAFNLKIKDDFEAFSSLSPSLNPSAVESWVQYEPDRDTQAEKSVATSSSIKLTLHAEDLWRVGQGEAPLKQADNPPDLRPYYEPAIKWQHDKAVLDTRAFVIPGSSIKGVIRHRFQYHYARFLLPFNSSDNPAADSAIEGDAANDKPSRLAQIRTLSEQAGDYLFGSASDTSEKAIALNEDNRAPGEKTSMDEADIRKSEDGKGHRTRVMVSDAQIESVPTDNELFHLPHTSIDRFTGGVRHGALYTEELIWKNTVTATLEFDNAAFAQDVPEGLNSDFIVSALKLTLSDLTEGRLALGGGSAKGHGYFSGELNFFPGIPEFWELETHAREQEVA